MEVMSNSMLTCLSNRTQRGGSTLHLCQSCPWRGFSRLVWFSIRRQPERNRPRVPLQIGSQALRAEQSAFNRPGRAQVSGESSFPSCSLWSRARSW